MRIYLIELRRSPLLWSLPVLIAVDLASVFGRSQYWMGIWPQASAAAQLPSLFFAPLVAAAVCWSANRSLGTGMAEYRSAVARASWRIEAVQLAVALTYAITAYLTGAVAAAAVSLADAGPGFLWPGYVLLGAGVITACAAVGHFVGRRSRSPVVSPVICGLACFVVIAAAGGHNGLELFFLSGPPQLGLDPLPLTARMLIALLLLLFAVFAPVPPPRGAARWRGARPRTAVACWATVMAAALMALPAVGPVRVERTASEGPLCSSGVPRVCLWPENRKYLPELSAMAERLAGIPQDWVRPPDSFHERGLRPDGPDAVAGGFDTTEGQMWFAAVTMASATKKHSLEPSQPCDPRRSPEAEQAYAASDELWLWLQFRALGTTGDPQMRISGPQGPVAAAREAVRMSEDDQRRWTGQRLAALRKANCV